jgi:aspartate ammonia-lyase
LASYLATAAEPNANSKQPANGATRTEHDLPGDKQVPANAYYGVQTARAL